MVVLQPEQGLVLVALRHRAAADYFRETPGGQPEPATVNPRAVRHAAGAAAESGQVQTRQGDGQRFPAD